MREMNADGIKPKEKSAAEENLADVEAKVEKEYKQ